MGAVVVGLAKHRYLDMEYLETVEGALKTLAASVLAAGGLVGASDDEVRAALGPLSELVSGSYAMFLRAVGRSAGEFLQGSDFLVEDLPGLQALGAEIRDEEPKAFVHSSPRILVFAAHQGYQFLFVDREGDDAPVYRYLEGEGLSKVADSFAEWFASAVEGELRAATDGSA